MFDGDLGSYTPCLTPCTGFVCPANVTRLLEVLKDFRGLAMDIANLRMG